MSAAWAIECSGFSCGLGVWGPATLSTKYILALTNCGNVDCARPAPPSRVQARDAARSSFGAGAGAGRWWGSPSDGAEQCAAPARVLVVGEAAAGRW